MPHTSKRKDRFLVARRFLRVGTTSFVHIRKLHLSAAKIIGCCYKETIEIFTATNTK